MKIQLGKTAKLLSGSGLAAEPRGDGAPGVDLCAVQQAPSCNRHVRIELDCDEAEKLGRELLDAARAERGREYREWRASIPPIDHKCVHCGYEWRGAPDERCPHSRNTEHPRGIALPTLRPVEIAALEAGPRWARDSLDLAATADYDRDVLNALADRGLVEFHHRQASWRRSSVGHFIVNDVQRLRREGGAY